MAKAPLSELQTKAFYAVLQSFALETSSMSSLSQKRTEIIEKMLNELEISDENQITVTNKIKQNLEILQEMEDSSSAMSSIVPKPGESWESIKPESLNGKWVIIRQSDTHFNEYIIKGYNQQKEMHCLARTNSGVVGWLDLRNIDPNNLAFEGGVTPNLDTPNKSASPIQQSLSVQ